MTCIGNFVRIMFPAEAPGTPWPPYQNGHPVNGGGGGMPIQPPPAMGQPPMNYPPPPGWGKR